jgi:hypothetical protein
MRGRNATNREILDAVRDTWEFRPVKTDLIKNMTAWIKAVKLKIDPLRVSDDRAAREIDAFILRKQERIIGKTKRSDEDQMLLDAIDEIWT